MRPVGFSTGAVAAGDFRAALYLLGTLPVNAVELSALRIHELNPLIAALPSLDLHRFRYCSVHAPSRFSPEDEPSIVLALATIPEHWPIVLHPDQIKDANLWKRLGSRLAIENMDPRKSFGQTVKDLDKAFEWLPEARFCLDFGHAVACGIAPEAFLDAFSPRLAQIHVSEVDEHGAHRVLTDRVLTLFDAIAGQTDVPIIIESVVGWLTASSELRRIVCSV